MASKHIGPSEATEGAARPPLSPEEYSRILQGMELVSISLTDVSASADYTVLASAMENGGVPLEVSEKASFTADADVRVQQLFTVTCRHHRKRCLVIKATYSVVLKSAEPFTEEFFSVFRAISLPVYTWPYFRELSQSITIRMGLPPLVLPLVRPPAAAVPAPPPNGS